MYEFTISGMSHGPSQQAIIGAILALDGNAMLNFNIDSQKVSVTSSVDLALISEAIVASGHRVERITYQPPIGHDAPGHHCDMCD
ncbi:MAG: hypothetical protein RLZZ227_1684 [Pseudomonadota bacterium]|jgi:copper chaperone CopZ